MKPGVKISAAVAATAVAAAVLYLYYNVDPSSAAWMPRCPSKMLTGLDCPGCGSQRALHALLHGDLAASLRFNALLIPAMVTVALITAAEWQKERWPRFHKAMTGNVAVYATLSVIILWAIVRNLLPIN